MSSLAIKTSSKPVYRVARHEQGVWNFPNWLYAHNDGTFGSRYDDPNGDYRVLYACSQRRYAFIEVLSYHAPDPDLITAFREIAENDDTDNNYPTAPIGSLDVKAWCSQRSIGTANIAKDRSFVSVTNDITLSTLVHRFASLAGVSVEEIRTTHDRSLTQPISRFIWEQSTALAEPLFAGIHYHSRHNPIIDNWALFELTPAHGEHNQDVVIETSENQIKLDDPDLIAAFEYLKITNK